MVASLFDFFLSVEALIVGLSYAAVRLFLVMFFI